VAIFGTIYAGELPKHLATAIPPGLDPRAVQNVRAVHALPEAVKGPIVQAYVDTLQTMFMVAAPVGLIALVVALFLKEVPLRDTARMVASGNSGVGESFAVPASNDSEAELEKVIALVVSRQKHDPRPELVARSGVPLNFAQAWLLGMVFKHSVDDGDATLHEIAELTKVPAGIFEPVARQLVDLAYFTEAEGHYRFTPKGTEAFARLIGAARNWLLSRLADWQEADDQVFAQAIDQIAEKLIESSRELSSGRHAAV
jgi:hypothetical protein